MWSDLFAMLADVREHVKTTGHKVETWDDPLERRLGYRDGEKVWTISLTDVKRAIVAAREDADLQATLEAFKTPEGRMRLVALGAN
jgi:hypothetical protein